VVAIKRLQRSTIFVLCLVSAVALSRCGGANQTVLPLTILPASLPNGTLATLYRQTIQVGGGVAPFNWSLIGELPHSLQLVPDSGNSATISGTPDTAAQGVAFSIKVTDSANQSATQSFTVSILADPDTLSFSPTTGLSFSPQLVGTASATQAETVNNNGTLAVAINSAGLTGINAADFGQTNNCGSSLAAGANCGLIVTFRPNQMGSRSASIKIVDSTLGSPHSVSLSGVGLTSGTNATLSTSILTFGNQAVGTTSPAQSLMLSNYGTATLTIMSIAASADFGETDTCSGSSLASGASCTIDVTFKPSAAGSASGTLSITDDALSSPQIVLLSGTGVTSMCIPQGGACFGPGPNNQCCPAPRGHHSFCSNPTGWGTCVES
jgi:Abnormal spindle-like microcephaly-assoc'd, ASPM-SPD-2-Hydin